MTGRMHEAARTGLCALALVALASSAQAADAGKGKRVYQKCVACHVADRETNRFGPHLKGVVGRPAAQVPDYKYSQAMKDAGAAGLVWDDAALSAFLSSPKKKVPGTSMRFFGLWTQAEIDDVIAYLKTTAQEE